MFSSWHRLRTKRQHIGAGTRDIPAALRLEALEDRTLPSVTLSENYPALNFGQSGGYVPPDTAGAAGPTAYVETVNQAIELFDPRTSNATYANDSLQDFWFTQGGLHDPAGSVGAVLSDPMVVWDEHIQRFIVGDQDVDFTAISDGGKHVSAFFLAVSKTDTPTSLTASDWTFYSINTSENSGTAGYTNNFDADYPGNFGYNAGAFVFTLNMFGPTSATDGGPPDDAGPSGPSGPGGGGGHPIDTTDHLQVISVDSNVLKNGTALASGTSLFRTDYAGFSLRPTTMHDGTGADAMWFVQDDGDGSHVDVVKMAGVLSNSPSFTTTTLAVKPFTEVQDNTSGGPIQPDGSQPTTHLDSRILKVAEAGQTLVATQTVTNATPSTVSGASWDRDLARWYAIDVSGGTPTLRDQGDVTSATTGAGQANVYDYFPGIDIDAAGVIGMSFMQSSYTGPDQGEFMSMYVTGREPGDAAGTMETPVLVPAGKGVADYSDFSYTGRAGDMSGVNVDADGSFWAINEFADGEDPNTVGANWGTAVAHFGLPISADLGVTLTPPAAASEGGLATYTIAVTNSGPSNATNVVLTAPVPAGAAFVNCSFTGYNASNGQVSLGTVPANHTVTVTLTVRLGEAGVYSSTAGAASDVPDPSLKNNQANAQVTATDAALTGQAVSSLAPTAGAPFSGAVAGFTDAYAAAPLGDFTATIAWGDGSSSAGVVGGSGGSFTVTGRHTYASAGHYAVVVVVHDTDGAVVRVVSQASALDAKQSVGTHQSANLAFWTGANKGQALINSFGPSATALASWLATNFPNLFGASLGGGGKTNADVASLMASLAGSTSTAAEAEILATALNVYATTQSLGGSAASGYGFAVTANGLGASGWNVQAGGATLNLQNNASYTVWQLLRAADAHARAGRLAFATTDVRYGQVASLFHGINQAGGL